MTILSSLLITPAIGVAEIELPITPAAV